MKAVVLAAGEGHRLRPLTRTRPKVMIAVGNKPILEYVLDALAVNNVRKVILVTGFHREQIMNYFGDGKQFGIELEYVVQTKLLGTLHALLTVRERLDTEFLVLPGDNVIFGESLTALLSSDKPSTLLTPYTGQTKFGSVVITEQKKLKSIVSKKQPRQQNLGEQKLICTGIFKFEPEIVKLLYEIYKSGNVQDLIYAVEMLLSSNRLELDFAVSSSWAEAVYAWDLLNLNSLALQSLVGKKDGIIESNVVIQGAVAIGKNTIIRSGSYIRGPVNIGAGCEIGPMSCILPATSIGNNVKIGAYSYIRQSIIMNDCKLDAYVHLVDSIIGEGCRIGPNFMIASGDSFVRVNDEFHQVRNFGLVVADDCQIGAGVVATPGTIVGARVKIGAGSKLTGNIKSDVVVV